MRATGFLAAFVAGLAIVLPACGGSAAPAQLTKVKVVAGNPTISRLPYFIALTKGFFKDEGLDVEAVSMSGGGSDAAKLLASNAGDFFVGQVVDTININKAQLHVQGIAMLTNRSSNGVVIRKDLAGKVKSMADIKGPDYVIGVVNIGSGTWQFIVYTAQLAGVSKDQLNFVVMQPSATAAAMKAGRINVSSSSDPEAFQMVADGVVDRLIDPADEKVHQQLIGNEYINNQVIVTESLIKSRPAVVQSFVNGIQRSLNWLRTNSPQDIAAELKKSDGFDLPDPVLVGTLERMKNAIPATPVISQDALNNTMKLPLATGGLDAPMPFDVLVDNQFAEKAGKTLGTK